MKRRLEIARGLMHAPRVLFLDEPTVGLDPQTRASIWTYIRQLKEAEEITIFLTTHYMDEAENCDRIAIMDKGQIVVLDTPARLKEAVGKDRVQIETDDDEAAIAALRERFGLSAQIADGAVTFGVSAGEQFVPRLFAELGLPIRSVSVSRPSLDDVFLLHTGSTIRDAEENPAVNRQRMMARVMGGYDGNHAERRRTRGAPHQIASVRVPAQSLRGELRAIKIVWQRELIRFSKDRLRIVTSLVQPFLFLFVLGTGLSRLAQRGHARG